MTLGSRFWRMYAASATSNLADGIGRTALPLAAASYTRDPVAVSGLVTFAFLPWLFFALPSGALVDRVDRRLAMAAANALRALASGALVIIVLADAGNIVVLYGVALALGLAETVYDSAVRALLPQVVGRPDLDRANGLLTVEETLGQTFLGAPLGAALFSAAVALPFLLDTAGFVLAVVLILAVRGRYQPERTGPRTTVRTDVAEGVRWLHRHRLLRGLTVISAGTSGAQSMVTGIFVLYVLQVLRLPTSAYGYVLLTAGVGALAGGLVTPVLAARFGRPVVLTIGSVVAALATGAMGGTRHGVVAAVLFGFAAAGVMTWNVLTMSLRQALIPAALFGRVQGAYRTLVWGAIPLGSLVGGVLAHVVGLRGVFVVAGAGQLVLAFALGRLLHRHRAELATVEPEIDPAPTPELEPEPGPAATTATR